MPSFVDNYLFTTYRTNPKANVRISSKKQKLISKQLRQLAAERNTMESEYA